MSNGITITGTRDGLLAYVLVTDTRIDCYPSREEILAELHAHRVVFGIDPKAIDELVERKIIGKSMRVAKGTAPQPGVPGRIDIVVDISPIGKPKLLPDGRVDFYNIGYIINVKKGDVLAKRVHPVQGKNGTSVFGKPIPVVLLEPAKFLPGPGTRIFLTNPDEIVADRDGGFHVSRDGTIEVYNEKRIDGDINYETGSINFPGNLIVTGTVRQGFSLEATGSIVIYGGIEDCSIRCGGDLEIRGGAVGSGLGTINCKGSITLRHLQNFKVYAGEAVTVAEDIVNSTVTASKVLLAKSIVGGKVASALGIEAEAIGSVAEIKTIINIGAKYERMHHRYELLSKLAALTKEFGANKERIFHFVRDNLDEKGSLIHSQEKALAVMKLKTIELHKAYGAMQAEIEKLDKLRAGNEQPYVKAKLIYPNTIIEFGVGEELMLKKKENVRLAPLEKENAITLEYIAAT